APGWLSMRGRAAPPRPVRRLWGMLPVKLGGPWGEARERPLRGCGRTRSRRRRRCRTRLPEKVGVPASKRPYQTKRAFCPYPRRSTAVLPIEPMREIPIEHRGDIVIAHWPPHPTAEGVHVFFDEMEALLQVRPRAVVLDALAVESAPIADMNAAWRRQQLSACLRRVHPRSPYTISGAPLTHGSLTSMR